MNNACLSFIVPVFNPNPLFFNEALDSILNQDCDLFEIIIVDDGSDDKSYLDKYRDNNKITIIENIHVGLSHSRNTGIKASNAPFISFVDCDDIISKSFVSTFIQIQSINKIDNDIILFASVSDKEKFQNYNGVCNFVPSFEFTHSSLKQFIYRGKSNKHPIPFIEDRSCWGKIYPRSLITSDCLFDENVQSYGEDVVFNWKLYYKANRLLCFDKTIMYFYRENEGSLVRRYVPNMEARFENLVKALELVIKEREDYWKKQLSLDCFNIFIFNIFKFSIFSKLNKETNSKKFNRFNSLVYKSYLTTYIIKLKSTEIISSKKMWIHVLLKMRMKRILYFLLRLNYKKEY